MREIIFVREEAPEGGYLSRAPGESILTEAETINELHVNVRDAVTCHFEEERQPKLIRLHHVKEEVLTA